MALNEVDQLAARVGEPIEDLSDVSLAESMLEDAWAWVRHYGDPGWGPEVPGTPGIARTVALNSASRGYQNPAGFDEEKSDSVSLGRNAAFSQLTHPAEHEVLALQQAASRRSTTFGTMQTKNARTYPSRWDAYNQPRRPDIPITIGNPNHGTLWTGRY